MLSEPYRPIPPEWQPVEPDFGQPPKPFRSLRSAESRLTTVIAIQADDGLVVGSDLQRTGIVREFVPKLKYFRPLEILGFAGIPFYEGVLFRHIKREILQNPSRDYAEILTAALDSFSGYLEHKLRRENRRPIEGMRPQGILAACERPLPVYRLFEFQPPDYLTETELEPKRAAIGSGGDVAKVFLKTIEKFMGRAGIDLGWKRFSSHTIRQLVWLLLDEASDIDPFSRGRDIQVITEKNVEGINDYNPVFQSPDDCHLSEFIQRAIGELSSTMPRYILEQFDLLDLVKGLRLERRSLKGSEGRNPKIRRGFTRRKESKQRSQNYWMI
jgi:20S proteasome alpha/beta subunit